MNTFQKDKGIMAAPDAGKRVRVDIQWAVATQSSSVTVSNNQETQVFTSSMPKTSSWQSVVPNAPAMVNVSWDRSNNTVWNQLNPTSWQARSPQTPNPGDVIIITFTDY